MAPSAKKKQHEKPVSWLFWTMSTQGFSCYFGHFEAIWALQNGTRKVQKGVISR
jgi:hypothetical protein